MGGVCCTTRSNALSDTYGSYYHSNRTPPREVRSRTVRGVRAKRAPRRVIDAADADLSVVAEAETPSHQADLEAYWRRFVLSLESPVSSPDSGSDEMFSFKEMFGLGSILSSEIVFQCVQENERPPPHPGLSTAYVRCERPSHESPHRTVDRLCTSAPDSWESRRPERRQKPLDYPRAASPPTTGNCAPVQTRQAPSPRAVRAAARPVDAARDQSARMATPQAQTGPVEMTRAREQLRRATSRGTHTPERVRQSVKDSAVITVDACTSPIPSPASPERARVPPAPTPTRTTVSRSAAVQTVPVAREPDTSLQSHGPNVLYSYRTAMLPAQGNRSTDAERHTAQPAQVTAVEPSSVAITSVAEHIRATQLPEGVPIHGILRPSLTKRQVRPAHVRPSNWVVLHRQSSSAPEPVGEGPTGTFHEASAYSGGDPTPVPLSPEMELEDEQETDHGTPPPPLAQLSRSRSRTPSVERLGSRDGQQTRGQQRSPHPPLTAPPTPTAGLACVNSMRLMGYPVPAAKVASPPPMRSRDAASPGKGCTLTEGVDEASTPAVREDRAVGLARWENDALLRKPVSLTLGATSVPRQYSTPTRFTDLTVSVDAAKTPPHVQQASHEMRVTSQSRSSAPDAVPARTIAPDDLSQRHLSDDQHDRSALRRSATTTSEENPMRPHVLVPMSARCPDPGSAAMGPHGPLW